MSAVSDQELLEALKRFNTPSITNVVASYPHDSNCLGLHNPWTENWYTDQSIQCMFPDLGPRVGRAVTCVCGLPDPTYDRLSLLDIIDALDICSKPTILVIQQRFPPELADQVGLAGGILTAAIKAVGCVGVISNGPSRDMDEIRPMSIQYLLSETTPGHGSMAVHAVNVPVSVAGMDVAPGEIVHMDEKGACKFPADRLKEVPNRVRRLRGQEARWFEGLKNATSAADVRHVLSKQTYVGDEE